MEKKPSLRKIHILLDPNFSFSYPGSAAKNFGILTQKIVSKLSEI
jgi:hypothetical protein